MTARRLLMAGLLAVVGAGLTACGTEAAGNDLEVGDCVEDLTTLNSLEVESIDCDERHEFEMIGRFDVDDQDEYPGENELSAEGTERCQGEIFEDYVGTAFDPAGELAVSALYPSQQTWDEADDRTILCFAQSADGSATTGSVEG